MIWEFYQKYPWTMKSGKYHKMDMHSLLMQITAIWSWLGLAVKVPREELVEHALTNDLLCFVFPLPQWLWTTECSAERTSTRRPSTTCFTTWEPPALWPPSSVSTLPACPFLGFVAAVALQLIESKALQHTSAQLSCTFGGYGPVALKKLFLICGVQEFLIEHTIVTDTSIEVLGFLYIWACDKRSWSKVGHTASKSNS